MKNIWRNTATTCFTLHGLHLCIILLLHIVLGGQAWAEGRISKPVPNKTAKPSLASPQIEQKPRIKILSIRRGTGSWAWVLKSQEGSYITLTSQGIQNGLPSEAGASTGEPETSKYSALDAFAPFDAAILLIPFTDKLENDFLEAMRKLETESGHDFNTVVFEFPKNEAQDIWKDPKIPQFDYMELLLSYVATRAELEAMLTSDSIEDRGLAAAVLRKLRPSVAGPFLVRATTNPNELVRNIATEELKNGKGKYIPVLRTATLNGNNSHLKDLLVLLEYESAVYKYKHLPNGYLDYTQANAYEDFLARYPGSRYETEMRYRMLIAKKDKVALKRLVDTFPSKGLGKHRDNPHIITNFKSPKGFPV